MCVTARTQAWPDMSLKVQMCPALATLPVQCIIGDQSDAVPFLLASCLRCMIARADSSPACRLGAGSAGDGVEPACSIASACGEMYLGGSTAMQASTAPVEIVLNSCADSCAQHAQQILAIRVLQVYSKVGPRCISMPCMQVLQGLTLCWGKLAAFVGLEAGG